MEIMIFLVVVVVIGFFIAVGLAGWLAFGLSAADSRKQKRDEENADAILDCVFDGSRTVVHTPADSKLTFETLVRGADERGYRLLSSEGDGLVRKHVFEKID